MDEIKIKGKVILNGHYDWILDTEDTTYTSNILTGIDEILIDNKKDILNEDDEIELILKVKRNK